MAPNSWPPALPYSPTDSMLDHVPSWGPSIGMPDGAPTHDCWPPDPTTWPLAPCTWSTVLEAPDLWNLPVHQCYFYSFLGPSKNWVHVIFGYVIWERQKNSVSYSIYKSKQVPHSPIALERVDFCKIATNSGNVLSIGLTAAASQ